MSFSATIEPMRRKQKTVTRRAERTWRMIGPGSMLLAVEKSMGLKKGEKVSPLGVILVTDVSVLPLGHLDFDEACREGFDGVWDFEHAWRKLNNGYDPEQMVRRIEFEHLPIPMIPNDADRYRPCPYCLAYWHPDTPLCAVHR